MPSTSSQLEVVVLAAGKGTRMKSELPKVLHTVCGMSLLERVLRAAAGLVPQRLIIVIGCGEELMREEIARVRSLPFLSQVQVDIVVQEEQKGTGHAAQIALKAVSSSAQFVLILAGDTPLISTEALLPLVCTMGEQEAELVFLSAQHQNPAGFGRIVRSADGAVQKIVEERDCTADERKIDEINTSTYLSSRVFLEQALCSLRADNAQGELYLTDIVEFAKVHGYSVYAQMAEEIEPLMGANSRYELSCLESQRREQINRTLMEGGVTLEDPASTYIDEGVSVGRDSVLGPGTRLKGNCVIAERVVIEGNSFIENSTVGAGSRIRFGSYLQEARVGADCQIGPFAHLRPGTLLHDTVKIGNFVETKKVELHPGVKANHLTYLGDSEVGAGTNIGAGTITCNYDGVQKHKTKIEENCFIGSNTSLVAPVCIGAGAYIGAGSTITKNVPAEALGVARGVQKNVDAWAKQKAKKKG